MGNFIDEQVLIISPEAHLHEKISASVQKHGLAPVSCHGFERARTLHSQNRFGLIFCDDVLPDATFQTVIEAVKPVPVIVLSRLAEWDSYMAALRAGAYDYIACPPSPPEIERIMRAALVTHKKAACVCNR
jgi:two-component system, NtrC family, response regulator PilR